MGIIKYTYSNHYAWLYPRDWFISGNSLDNQEDNKMNFNMIFRIPNPIKSVYDGELKCLNLANNLIPLGLWQL